MVADELDDEHGSEHRRDVESVRIDGFEMIGIDRLQVMVLALGWRAFRVPVFCLSVLALGFDISPTTSVGDSADFWKWLVTQGGLVAVLFVGAWSYRKDLLGVLKEERDRLAIMKELIMASTSASTMHSEQSKAMVASIERLTQAIGNLKRS